MKKRLLILFLTIIILTSLISAINLEIEKDPVANMAIIELNKPAIINLEITNKGSSSNFEIYSLVGVELEPKETIFIEPGETESIELKIYPKSTPEFYSFEYKIRDENEDIQNDNLDINIVHLNDAFEFSVDNIDLESQETIVYLENKGGHNLEDIKAEISSVFFNQEIEFSLEPFGKREFKIDIDKELAKEVIAGNYIVEASLIIENKTASLSSVMKFAEKSGIDTVENIEGLLLRRHEIEKRNLGNIPEEVVISFNRDIFSSLFTTFNILPSKKENQGFNVKYIFRKQLGPDESLRVIAKTNWIFPILIIVILVLIIYFAKRYSSSKLILRKKVSFVRTKGGEFALKVSIIAKARSFCEKIRVIDKLPAMVKVFERYGTIAPDNVDEKNRRLEWTLDSLGEGEERVLSYIIYSKISILGKFELPEARAIYEHQGKVKETESNKAFFINESRNN